MEAAFLEGVSFVRQVVVDKVPEAVEIVVTSAAGYPLDTTFYQAVKGMCAAAPIVRPGGTIVLAASMTEGVGSPAFCRLFDQYSDLDAFSRDIADRPCRTVDQWQLEKLALVTTGKHVLFYTPGLPQEYHGSLWGRAFESPESALKAFAAGLEPGSRVAVIPEGPYVLAKAGSAERETVEV